MSPATTATASEVAPLKALQAAFRPSYDAARQEVEKSLTPLVVVRFSDMYLVKDGRIVAEAKGIPAKYHMLHRTAHVPLVIYGKIGASMGKPITKAVGAELDEYRRLVVGALSDLDQYGFTPAEIEKQRLILNESGSYLGVVAKNGMTTANEFAAYRAKVQRAVMDLADAAGAAQVDATHAAMIAWRSTLTDDEWRSLRVMIIGLRQPRRDYAATQYFAALFPERGNTLFPGENQRVFYVETPTIDRSDKTFAAERRLVASVILDAAASEAMFNNADRMSIDVMADGARRRVAELDLVALRR